MANASILDETTALGETKRLVLVYIYALRRHNRALGTLDAVAPTYPASALINPSRLQVAKANLVPRYRAFATMLRTR